MVLRSSEVDDPDTVVKGALVLFHASELELSLA